MAQPFLFGTSYLMLLVHAVAVCVFGQAPVALQISYIVGPLTGMWNHATTSEYAKWTDRSVMLVGLCIDLAYLQTRVLSWVCLIGALVLYGGAKCLHYDLFFLFGPSIMLHALSHGSVTAAHVLLLYSYHHQHLFF